MEPSDESSKFRGIQLATVIGGVRSPISLNFSCVEWKHGKGTVVKLWMETRLIARDPRLSTLKPSTANRHIRTYLGTEPESRSNELELSHLLQFGVVSVIYSDLDVICSVPHGGVGWLNSR